MSCSVISILITLVDKFMIHVKKDCESSRNNSNHGKGMEPMQLIEVYSMTGYTVFSKIPDFAIVE